MEVCAESLPCRLNLWFEYLVAALLGVLDKFFSPSGTL